MSRYQIFVSGNAGAGITCYSLALNEAPIQYKDLVLTNLGALLYRLGHVDSALRLLQEAVAISDSEPETHFFLANLFAAKVNLKKIETREIISCFQGNMTGAIEHYRATLRLEPEYPGGIEQLRIPSCYIKYHHSAPKQSLDSQELNCLLNQQGSDMKCGQERQQVSCGAPGVEDQHRRCEHSTLTSIQVRKMCILDYFEQLSKIK